MSPNGLNLSKFSFKRAHPGWRDAPVAKALSPKSEGKSLDPQHQHKCQVGMADHLESQEAKAGFPQQGV